jgi:hypothetical protein
MQPPFLLTQSRNLHNDSMWKKKLEVIPPYKIVVVRTYILIFLTHCPPPSPSLMEHRPGLFVLMPNWWIHFPKWIVSHKKKRFPFGRSSIRQRRYMNGMAKSWRRLTKVTHIVVPNQWNPLSTGSTGWWYATNIVWKLFANKRNLGLWKFFSMMLYFFSTFVQNT